MRGLIYKDFYLIKGKMIAGFIMTFLMIIIMSIIIVASSGPSGINTSFAALANIFMDIMILQYIGFNYIYIMQADMNRKWGLYGACASGGVSGVVAAKYMSVFILYFVTFVLCRLLDLIIGLVIGTAVDNSGLVIFLILIFIFINSIEMPLAFRFGPDKSTAIRILISVVIVLIITIYLLFGNIDWLMKEDGVFKSILNVITHWGEDAEVLPAEVKKIIEKMTYLNYIALAVIAYLVVLGYYISYRISCKVFKKGVLRDDI